MLYVSVRQLEHSFSLSDPIWLIQYRLDKSLYAMNSISDEPVII